MALRGGRVMNMHFSRGASLRATPMVYIGYRGPVKALASSTAWRGLVYEAETIRLEGWAEA